MFSFETGREVNGSCAEDVVLDFRFTMVVFQIVLFLTGNAIGSLGQCFKDVDVPPTKHMLLYGMEDFFGASNRFSIRLLHALNTTRDTFISSFSVWSSLILVYLGSRGSTERELESVLGLQGLDKSSVAHSYRALRLWFTGGTPSSSTFSMTNKLFFQKDVRVRKCLLELIEEDTAFADFADNPELARMAINYLVRHATKDSIREILPPHSVRGFTEFIVVSTMHFKGAWLQPFFPHGTRPRPFFKSNLEYVVVDMMVTKATFYHAASDELQCTALELPYTGGSLTMVVLLPHNRAHGVQILASSLTPARLDNLTEDMFPREVVVALPRFRMEDSFRLSSTLHRMGLRDLTSGLVDLSGFAGGRTLQVNEVYHKAHVSVDESGTEAAAATAGAASRSSRPTRTLEFVADRPFVFFIRENHSGSILFLGVVRDPKYLTPKG